MQSHPDRQQHLSLPLFREGISHHSASQSRQDTPKELVRLDTHTNFQEWLPPKRYLHPWSSLQPLPLVSKIHNASGNLVVAADFASTIPVRRYFLIFQHELSNSKQHIP